MLLFSCKTPDISNPFAARVGLRFLTEKALVRELGEDAGDEEKAAFVEQWVDETLWYRAAKKALRPDKRMRRQIKDYRRQLYVNRYQNKTLRQSYHIEENDILEYYKKNTERYRAVEEAVFVALYNCENASIADEIYQMLKDGNSPSVAEYRLLYKSDCSEPFSARLFTGKNSGPLAPVSVRDRYYVISVLERYNENSLLRMEHVREDIIQKLQIEAYMDAYQKKYNDLKEHVNVKIY